MFVHRDGGSAEIVRHPELQFADVTQAIEKIDRVLRAPELEDRLRVRLQQEARAYSVERFVTGLRRWVTGFRARPRAAASAG